MKVVVLVTMTLAIMAPVLGQQSEARLWKCITCNAQRLSKFMPDMNAGKEGCFSRGTEKKYKDHTWYGPYKTAIKSSF
jgi:hypothetical protein